MTTTVLRFIPGNGKRENLLLHSPCLLLIAFSFPPLSLFSLFFYFIFMPCVIILIPLLSFLCCFSCRIWQHDTGTGTFFLSSSLFACTCENFIISSSSSLFLSSLISLNYCCSVQFFLEYFLLVHWCDETLENGYAESDVVRCTAVSCVHAHAQRSSANVSALLSDFFLLPSE